VSGEKEEAEDGAESGAKSDVENSAEGGVEGDAENRAQEIRESKRVFHACQACGQGWDGPRVQCARCGAWGTVAFDPEQARLGPFPSFTSRHEPLDEGDWDEDPEEGEGPDTEDSETEDLDAEGEGGWNVPSAPQAIGDVPIEEFLWIPTGIEGMDRVLGGGYARKLTVLLSAKPGSGKSTLVLSSLSVPAESGLRCLYLSGEEKSDQVARRGRRIGASSKIDVVSERNLERAITIAKSGYDVACFDSAQVLYDGRVTGQPGGITQVKNVGLRLTELAQTANMAVVVIAQVSKDGKIAGPNHLVHIVDTHCRLLKFKNDRRGFSCPEKNRAGRTPQIWRCKMDAVGKVVDAEAEWAAMVAREVGAELRDPGARMRRMKKGYDDG
jgi:predicted ATP-dependent serine protease